MFMRTLSNVTLHVHIILTLHVHIILLFVAVNLMNFIYQIFPFLFPEIYMRLSWKPCTINSAQIMQ
jgi:hypothetical protein